MRRWRLTGLGVYLVGVPRVCGSGASHLSVMVAANKGFDRKAFAEQFEAWSRFCVGQTWGAVVCAC